MILRLKFFNAETEVLCATRVLHNDDEAKDYVSWVAGELKVYAGRYYVTYEGIVEGRYFRGRWDSYQDVGKMYANPPVIHFHNGRYDRNYLRSLGVGVRCERCGLVYFPWALHPEHDQFCWSCGEVVKNDEDYYNPIINLKEYLSRWDTRQPVSAKINRSRQAYLGFEFEVIQNGDLRQQQAESLIKEMTNLNVISKRDGSVDGEFISKPLLLPESEELACKMVDLLKLNKFLAWERGKCGFHIHVNRKSVHDEKKLLYFFIHQRDTILKISGRTDDQYCRFDPAYMESNFRIQNDSWRYSAINFANRHTIEIRCWRGTLKKERLLMYLRLSRFLALWSDHLLDLDWSDISYLVNDQFLTEIVSDKIDQTKINFLNNLLKADDTNLRWTRYKKALSRFNCVNSAELMQAVDCLTNRAFLTK